MFVTYNGSAYRVASKGITPFGVPVFMLHPYRLTNPKRVRNGRSKYTITIHGKVLSVARLYRINGVVNRYSVVVFGGDEIFPITLDSFSVKHVKIHPNFK
jgi:hypothetical protein